MTQNYASQTEMLQHVRRVCDVAQRLEQCVERHEHIYKRYNRNPRSRPAAAQTACVHV